MDWTLILISLGVSNGFVSEYTILDQGHTNHGLMNNVQALDIRNHGLGNRNLRLDHITHMI